MKVEEKRTWYASDTMLPSHSYSTRYVEEKWVLFFGEPRKIFKNCATAAVKSACPPRHSLNIVREALERRRRARQTKGSKEPAKCTRREIYRTISNGTTVNIGFCRRERTQGSNVFLVKWSNYPDLSVT